MLDRETVEEICGPVKPLRAGSESRWIACEVCGGSGEIIRGRDGDDWNEPCGVCEGTGRDCVETSSVECNDDLED